MFGKATMLHAYSAVDLFFVLSGFVLAHAYDRRFDDGMTVFQFMKLRLIRLYPMYLAGVLFSAGWIVIHLVQGLPVTLLQHQPWTWEHLRIALQYNLFFVPNPQLGAGPPALYALNIPAWSLMFEILINLAFASLWPRLTTFSLGVLVAVFAVWMTWAGLNHGSLNAGFEFRFLDIAAARVCFGFFAGVRIYRLSGHAPAWLKVPPLILLAVIVAAFYWTPTGKTLAWYDIGLDLVLIPLLVFLGSRVEPGRWTRPAYSFGGRTSYGVYAIHYPLYYAATVWFTKAGYDSAAHAPISGIILLAGLMTLAWLLDRYYDGPVRAWLTRRRSAEPVPAVS